LPKRRKIFHLLKRFLLLALVAVNIGLLVSVLAVFVYAIDRGFDFTDEAFYILNAWYPKDNLATLTEFGFYLNIFVELFGKNVALLRALGIFGLMTAGAFLAYQLVQYCREKLQLVPTNYELIVLTNTIMLASLVYYRVWMITPSYIWFSLLGAMLVASGGVLALRTFGFHSKFSELPHIPLSQIFMIAIVISVGGFVGFIGRPTTGVALGFIIGIWLITALRVQQWLAVGSIALLAFITLLAAHVWWLGDGLIAVINRFEIGRDLATELQAGQTLSSIVRRAASSLIYIPVRFLGAPMIFGYMMVAGGIVLALIYRKFTNKFKSIHWGTVFSVSVFFGFSVFVFMWIPRVGSITISELPSLFGLEMALFLGGLLILNNLGSNTYVRRRII